MKYKIIINFFVVVLPLVIIYCSVFVNMLYSRQVTFLCTHQELTASHLIKILILTNLTAKIDYKYFTVVSCYECKNEV